MKLNKMILSALVLCSLACDSQIPKGVNTYGKKESYKLDTAHIARGVDTVQHIKTDNLSLTMSKSDWNELLLIIQTADRKEQTINLWIKTIVAHLKAAPDAKKN